MPKIQVSRIYNKIQEAFDKGFRVVSEQGSARCFARGTLVRMADGTLKAVEDIQQGDRLMDIASNGYNTVIETHHGYDNLYTVRQSRGIDYTVNSRHILSLRQVQAKPHKVAIPGFKSAEKRRIEYLPYDHEKIYDFDIKEYISMSGKCQQLYGGFKNTMLELPERPLLIDPYYLGVWLGDGSSRRIFEITNNDKEVLDWFYDFARSLDSKAWNCDRYTHKFETTAACDFKPLNEKCAAFRESFKHYNLINNKHVPEDYIYNSYENRLRFLAGLLDADAYQTKRNTLVLTQKKECIIRAVEEICRISGFCTLGARENIARMKRQDGTVYECKVWQIEINHNDFKDLNKYLKVPRRRVEKSCSRNYFNTSISITEAGYGEFFGFTLDNSPYFLLQDGTVVHNSAKTVSSVIWLITRCLQYAGTTVAIVRGTRPALAGTVYRDFEWAMQEMGVWDRDCMNKSEFIYRFPNGSWIEFFPATDDQRLRGRKRQILYVNEANEISYEEWTQLILRTTVFAIIDYNPSFGDEHWIVQKINDSPRTCFFISTYKDNPFLEQKVIDEIESLKDTSPNLWRVYGLGLRAVIEGRVFKDYRVVDELPYEARKHRFLGMDFGYSNDPTAIILASIIGKKLYLKELCYRTEMTTTDIINRCKEINKEYKENFKIWADSAEPREIAEIHNAGIDIHPVRKFAGSIIAGITKMQEFEIIITADSLNLKKELDNYIYRQDKDGKWLNEPIDAFNHLIDPTRYIVLSEVLGNNGNGLDAQEAADILF